MLDMILATLAQVGDNEACAGIQFPGTPLHLGHNTPLAIWVGWSHQDC